MDKISDHLWISDIVKDEDYDNLPVEIDRVVNVSGYESKHADLWYPLRDGKNQQKRFDAVVHNILKMMSNRETVLVHCAAGVSRSAAVCIAVLMQSDNLDYITAYEEVRDIRNNINPKPELELLAKGVELEGDFQ